MNSLKGSPSAPVSNFCCIDDPGVHYNALEPSHHTLMYATEDSCMMFHGKTHQFPRDSAVPDAKNVPQGTVMCRILSHESCAYT